MTRVTLVLCLLLSAGGASAQSLFATRGLGLPVPALDARARALGGIGIGLLGLNTSLVNPAEIAGVLRRGVTAALQPSSASPEIAGESGDVSASRFPLVRVIYPLSERVVATLGYGSFLEQSWGITTEGTEVIGGETVTTTDVVQSTGGIARVGVGLSYLITPSLAVGVNGGIHTGNLDRQIRRSFSGTDSNLEDFETNLRWDYRGGFVTGGVQFELPDVVRAGAQLTLSEDLDIQGEGTARDDKVSMPINFSAGASAVLSSTLMAAAGVDYTGGDGTPVFHSADATTLRRAAWRVGGGIEYGGLGSTQRTFPLRLGGSWSQLPFYNADETPASEWSASLGIGFRLAVDDGGPLAVADIALERGNRSGLESTAVPDGLRESFWRFTFSLALFGR